MSSPLMFSLSGTEFFPVEGVPLSVFRMMGLPILRHDHNFQELVLVVRGTARHELYAPGSDEPRSVLLSEGDLILVPLGWSHAYTPGKELEICNIIFDSSWLEPWAQDGAIFDLYRCHTPSELPEKWSLQLGEREYLETLLQSMMRELTGRQRGFDMVLRAKLSEFVVWLDRLNAQPAGQRESQSRSAIARSISFMEQHFADPISLEDIAQSAHLSPNYFCEVFRNITGSSPGRYLARLRLDHARYLLLTTTIPISEVANQAGFADASYFARAFKTTFGVPPTRLRATGR